MPLRTALIHNEGGLPFCGGEGGISEAVGGAAGGGERFFLNSHHTLVRLLPHVSVLEVEAFGVEFFEVLYGGGPHLDG